MKQQKTAKRTTKAARPAARKPAAAKGMHPIKYHAKRVYHLTPKFVHGMVAGAFVGIMVITGIRISGVASALTITSPRDCDSNAVITCGALTTSELQTRYKNKGVSSIYSYFGISSGDISNVHKTAQAGKVYKDGRVTVNGVVVATKARTAGRENISGSTKVTYGGVTFYTREPKVSFNPDYINAFVVMDKGTFKYAILGACGNPVSATPVPKKTTPTTPTPTPTPPPVKEEPLPPPPTTTSTQTPPSTPTATLASTSTPIAAQLPETGPGAVILVGALAIIGGYLFHAGHRQVQRKRHTRA